MKINDQGRHCFDNPVEVELEKIVDVLNPFEEGIWCKVETPIQKEEILKAIEEERFIAPFERKMVVPDDSTRSEHIERIAWLVQNFDSLYAKEPIDVDFPYEGIVYLEDGCHRLAAAIFLDKKQS